MLPPFDEVDFRQSLVPLSRETLIMMLIDVVRIEELAKPDSLAARSALEWLRRIRSRVVETDRGSLIGNRIFMVRSEVKALDAAIAALSSDESD